jgi:hypothetical protein
MEIGEQPLIEPMRDDGSYYRFFNSGFSLNVNSGGKIHSALVLIDNEATRAGFYKPFQQPLPYGIIAGDRCLDIENKLGMMASGVHKDTHVFHLPPHVLLFRFDGQTESIKSLAVIKQNTQHTCA